MTAPDPVTAMLAELHHQLAGVDEGNVADYIPRLAEADPTKFGLALVSTQGRIYRYGDADLGFSIQSVSKPFVYALVLTLLGDEAVSAHIGAEPSGDAFNAISLDPVTGRPANGMINAGAIVATSLVPGDSPEERFGRILDFLSRCAGSALDVDTEVAESEARTGHRNRALAHLTKASGALVGDPMEAVGIYFRQCGIRVTAVQLAVMASTLACGGVNPITGERVLSDLVTEHVLAVMASCGMYNAAGDWLVRVGLPAKSGVAGGLLSVSPSQFGIGILSPPLDAKGNPVRAVMALRALSTRFNFNLLHHAGTPAPTVWRVTDAEASPSHRIRPRRERHALEPVAARIQIVGGQGDVEFAAAERLTDAALAAASSGPATEGELPSWVVLDLSRVARLDDAATGILATTVNALAGQNVRVSVAAPPANLASRISPASIFETADEAVAWCEDDVLAHLGVAVSQPLELAQHDVLASLDQDDRQPLEAQLVVRDVRAGDVIFSHPGELLYAVLSGAVHSRDWEFGPGTIVLRGMAGFTATTQSQARAVTDGTGAVLTWRGLATLYEQAPALAERLVSQVGGTG